MRRYIPTLRKSAKDGAPVRSCRGWVEENKQRQQQIPFGDDNQKSNYTATAAQRQRQLALWLLGGVGFGHVFGVEDL